MIQSPVRNTINYLRRCQQARAAGYPVSYTTDPAWLLMMAINRRAGWPDDPGHWRGSAMPVKGSYPKRASGMAWNHLRLLAQKINTPRLIVHVGELGEWRKFLLYRIPHRITTQEDL